MTRARREGGRGYDEQLVIDGRRIAVTSPDKVLFPNGKHTKLDLVHRGRPGCAFGEVRRNGPAGAADRFSR